MLAFIKRYILLIISFIALFYFYQGDNKKLSATINDLDVIDKTKNIVIKPHLYNQIKDGKRLEVIAERGENNSKTIVIHEVIGKIYDIDNNCILQVQTKDGSFDIKDKILNIKKDIDISIYDNLNRRIHLKGSGIKFDMEKRLINSSERINIEDDKYSLSAESFEIDADNFSIIFIKPIIRKN